MIQLELWTLGVPMPGLTVAHGTSLGEAAAVCLETQQHQSGVRMRLDPAKEIVAEVHWRALPPNSFHCHTGDKATEDGACGIAILLAREVTGQVVLFRSERREGCDYWLGPADFPRQEGLKGMSRLEVSGMRRGPVTAVRNRLDGKQKQINTLVHPSDKYVAVVEFGVPIAVLEKI